MLENMREWAQERIKCGCMDEKEELKVSSLTFGAISKSPLMLFFTFVAS